jgi:hypothetical protein
VTGAWRVEPAEVAFRAAAERCRDQQKSNQACDSSAHDRDLIGTHALCHGRAVTHSDDVREDIARLEDEIERLILRRERCRKLSLTAKIAIVAGASWLACTLLGVVYFWPAPLLASLAAVIGGIVLLGSNATTWDQIDAAIGQANAARAQLIAGIELRVVDAGVRQVH